MATAGYRPCMNALTLLSLAEGIRANLKRAFASFDKEEFDCAPNGTVTDIVFTIVESVEMHKPKSGFSSFF